MQSTSQQLLNIVSLQWATRAMGAHLKIETLAKEILAVVNARIPGKNIRLALWDEQKRHLSLEVETRSSRVRFSPSSGSEMYRKASGLYAPIFKGTTIYCPLRTQDKFLGLLIFESPSGLAALRTEQEELIACIRLASVALGNIALLMESEKRGQDMFRFNVLSRALNPTVNETEIIKILSDGVEWMMPFDASLFLILSKGQNTLYIRSKKPLHPTVLANLKKLSRETFFNFTKNALNTSALAVEINAPSGKQIRSPVKAFLNAPLITKDKIIGLICLVSFQQDQFTPRDHQNLSALAAHGAVAFENAWLYADLRRTYFSIVSALTSAIEAKDRYTRGHSVLVSRYSVAIAQEMGLSASLIESIEIAGLLHDLGKLGVPEDILLKKDKLTPAEYEVVKSHPDIALKILGPVEFPHFKGQEKTAESSPELTLKLFELADLSDEVKMMIYHHHERYAGGGYPKGIKQEEIPLGARILAVADTFEALTADRPYRKAFSTDEAIKILLKIKGEQLDARIVTVFISLLRKKGVEALRESTAGSF